MHDEPTEGNLVRRRRLFCSLLLVAAAGLSTAGARPTDGHDRQAGRHAKPIALDQVIPAPASVRPGKDPYTLGDRTQIRVPGASGEVRRVAGYLADVLRPSTGYPLPVTGKDGRDGIVLRLGGKDTGKLGAEGYRLTSTRHAVTITAARPAGLFHGVQTLRQLLPPSVEKRSAQHRPWKVAGGTITDTPRYGYRGGMIDVGRHFFTVEQLKRYIDQLALYKYNKLHLHLTDDQGWRLQINSWPRLATYGGSTQVGGGPGGYYTKAQYREILRYAASRYMEVIPEIDTPGHTQAALASYAKLNCNNVAPPIYTGVEVGFSSLCVPKKVTYEFLDDVFRETAALTPGPYLHIGGDEAYSTSHADYVTFMNKVQPLVTKYKKKVIGWHQMTAVTPAKGAAVQYWGYDKTPAKEREQVAAAAREGAGLILSPADRSYLDMKYTKDTKLGKAWAGYVEVQRSYDWDPGTYLKGAPQKSIMGVEAPIWTETLSTDQHLDYMTFPRMPGIAELGWSPRSTHDWDTYKYRLAAQAPRWEAMGFDYYRSPQVPWGKK
ncbi:beta-N-acetylhexosaminidase [Streptomyces rimosus subsp. rimosus]|uniref:beta-N-acetylhexosaminidase n=2 Tax=Streptomyces rimosus subsp. rimosus TaxID=132474 RepID=L8EP12_STRR1|nr:beta-N-acetylhexosaminidase [Streptomyces rimosus]KOG72080.1 beta-N-acetylhexosaminidase [Kitasatospora aureofaciens]KOT36066.1 beta-N-acetylhexosaminidase [Streptomyces sp. NRRL WC-3701]KOT36508.1 beta-N-acetylhexosaminidase [Streptomyces rimosus subsp. rimosus]MYT44234.1 family 20 glycosylhydrolase [Streptomyces sp. SID5471]QST81239.1 family 20 glycosylhydrolase [Streptomyces rimosus subsp. rimosus ATCC 10970]